MQVVAMPPKSSSRKRKEPSKPTEPEDDFVGLELDGVLSQSDDDSALESDLDQDGFRAENRGSESELEDGDVSGDDENLQSEDDLSEQADEPNYRIVTDANGNERYEYVEVDPIYDSDDSDAQGPINTIGNIPLSFYDSYPHIGYDINGKKIMRPATGEALDALLDSIEIPKGWTGLTDPETGKPLNLSQDELELLRRLQMGEVPDEGYDPYPVCRVFLSLCHGHATNQ